MGEQSNAWRILLRNDRKSRHRRIKKRRRYERLAATSQFPSTAPLHLLSCGISSTGLFEGPMLVEEKKKSFSLHIGHLSVGGRLYLRHRSSKRIDTHTFAVVEARSNKSLVACWLSVAKGLSPECLQHSSRRGVTA